MSSTSSRAAADPTAKSPRSAETEALILDAARTLLAEGGMPALSMRVVAERVGLTATAIYHHFEGKEDLVGRVVRDVYAQFGEYLTEARQRHPKGSLERIVALGDAYVRFAFEHQECFRVLYSIQTRMPRDVDELPSGGGYDLLRGCVVDAMESGVLREVDPDLIAHYLWTSVHGLVTLALACNIEARQCCPGDTGAPSSAVDLYRAFTPFLVDGLRAGDGKPVADGDGLVWWKHARES